MVVYHMIIEAQECLVSRWGKKGMRVIEECAKVTPLNASSQEFISYCYDNGGDWGGMVLSGIKELWPNVWEVIPGYMGRHAFECLSNVLVLCGVDTSR